MKPNNEDCTSKKLRAILEIRTDAPIEEIRELRRSISARFDHDPVRLVAYYAKLQEQYRDRLIETATTTEPKDQTAA